MNKHRNDNYWYRDALSLLLLLVTEIQYGYLQYKVHVCVLLLQVRVLTSSRKTQPDNEIVVNYLDLQSRDNTDS